MCENHYANLICFTFVGCSHLCRMFIDFCHHMYTCRLMIFYKTIQIELKTSEKRLLWLKRCVSFNLLNAKRLQMLCLCLRLYGPEHISLIIVWLSYYWRRWVSRGDLFHNSNSTVPYNAETHTWMFFFILSHLITVYVGQ